MLALGPVEEVGIGHELRAFDKAKVKFRSSSFTWSDDDDTCPNPDLDACWSWTEDEDVRRRLNMGGSRVSIEEKKERNEGGIVERRHHN